jgi:hypothetical protein
MYNGSAVRNIDIAIEREIERRAQPHTTSTHTNNETPIEIPFDIIVNICDWKLAYS